MFPSWPLTVLNIGLLYVSYSDSALFVTFSLYVVLVCKKLLPSLLFIYNLLLSALERCIIYTLILYLSYIAIYFCCHYVPYIYWFYLRLPNI